MPYSNTALKRRGFKPAAATTCILIILLIVLLVQQAAYPAQAAHTRCDAEGDDRRTQNMEDAVRLTASATTSPAQITLNWQAHSSAADYVVYRKTRDAKAWGDGTSLGDTLQYVDSAVAVGSTYEYRVQRVSTGCANQSGYIYAGIEAPFVDERGWLILLVDDRFMVSLSAELETLRQDLIGDGWQVIRHDVSKDDSVSNVKQIILDEYNANPSGVKAVMLFGHIPVPYSGHHATDGHELRAFPADIYYGDVDGNWTDTEINQPSTVNPNVPGDGRFDQAVIEGSVDSADTAPELMVGRVDFWDMDNGTKSEPQLLRQYLKKVHNWRHKVVTVRQRGWISDELGKTFGWETPGIGQWTSMTPLVGSDTYTSDIELPTHFSGVYRSKFHPIATVNDIDGGDLLYGSNRSSPEPNYDEHGFIFADANSTGSYEFMAGSGTAREFPEYDPPVAFYLTFGSYFGDWDTKNNFLRGPLTQPTYGLSNVWSTWGAWQFHHMAMGEPIGHGVVATHHSSAESNGSRLYDQFLAPETFPEMNLMGDPALRMHVVAPPTDVVLEGSDLSWSDSAETVAGYHVYRADSNDGPFTRLTSNPISDTAYTDTNAPSDSVYMVRAIKLETSPSGTYFNASQGIFSSVPDSASLSTVIDAAANSTADTDQYSIIKNPSDSLGLSLVTVLYFLTTGAGGQ